MNKEDNNIPIMLYPQVEGITPTVVIPQESRGKMLICSNCGLDVHSDFKKCPRCGVKMSEVEE